MNGTTAEVWDAMASDYEEFTADPSSYSEAMEWPGILSLLPPLRGSRVLDVGCGTGRFSYRFEGLGAAEVVGTDVSAEMLRLAEEKRPPGSRVRFERLPAEALGNLGDGAFDLAFSSTASHYFPDLGAAFLGIADRLVPGGFFVLSCMHPLYTASYPAEPDGPWDTRYLDDRLRRYFQPWTLRSGRGEKVVCESFHHTLSDYVNSLSRSGLSILEAREPGPPASWAADRPDRFDAVLREPPFLIVKCRKATYGLAEGGRS